MGQNITREARIRFNLDRKNEIQAIKTKYQHMQTRNVLLVGPPQSGKTQLFRNLLNHEFDPEYKIGQTAQFGLKLFSTIKSKYEQLPALSVHICDSPGAMIRHRRGVDFYFQKCDVILIVMDISLVFDHNKIDNTTQFVLQQVSEHHAYIKDDDVLEPLICHVFTKLDKMNPKMQKSNMRAVKSLAKQGIIANYLFVSSKTDQHIGQLKQAIFDADIKGHGDEVKPYEKPTEKKRQAKAGTAKAQNPAKKYERKMEEVIEEEEDESKSDQPVVHSKTTDISRIGVSKLNNEDTSFNQTTDKRRGDELLFSNPRKKEKDMSKISKRVHIRSVGEDQSPFGAHEALREAAGKLSLGPKRTSTMR